MAGRRDCRVYIGNLPPDIRQRDLEDLFYKYGHINFIDVKLTRGAPFAFIEFDDPRDARDAIRGRDGYELDGCRIRVEMTRGVGPRGPGGRPLYGPDRGERDRRPPPPRGPPRRSGYRVLVTGLPVTGSWQDIRVKEAAIDDRYRSRSRSPRGSPKYSPKSASRSRSRSPIHSASPARSSRSRSQ